MKNTERQQPWDRQPGEPNVYYQRFNIYRMLGYNRSILAAFRVEKGDESLKGATSSWYTTAERWSWQSRAEAWDAQQASQAIKQVEAKWLPKIIHEIEILGRMSEHGRNDISLFFKVSERWTDNPLPTEEILQEEEYTKRVRGVDVPATRYLVRKVVLNLEAIADPELAFRVKRFTDSPKNGIGIELYDAASALQLMGKYRRLFVDREQEQPRDNSAFSLPAECIAPAFLDVYRDIRKGAHTEYVLHGGRGSTKSSFISLAILYLIMRNPTMHVLAVRQVANTLRDSVYNQILWAISELGLDDQFKCTVSPVEITYIPTGQKIFFRGADDPGKIKSIKPPFGYIGVLWFEELDQFHGEESIRKIEQSVIRGGDTAFIFKSFNPPRTLNNWANKYVKVPKETQVQHHSDYLGVPQEWLGRPFLEEAEHLKNVNPGAYEHEYLGLANSAGGLVFENAVLRKITDEEIAEFDRPMRGQDWGYYPDPAHHVQCHFDAARMTLYIYGEFRAWKTGNRALYDELVRRGLKPDDLIIADSAEPKSVADFREYGASCRGAEKGPESVKYSMKWLQSLAAIIIDPERAPYTAEEVIGYEYEQDSDGNYISEYPDRDNHGIDATRYATNPIWRRRGQ